MERNKKNSSKKWKIETKLANMEKKYFCEIKYSLDEAKVNVNSKMDEADFLEIEKWMKKFNFLPSFFLKILEALN